MNRRFLLLLVLNECNENLFVKTKIEVCAIPYMILDINLMPTNAISIPSLEIIPYMVSRTLLQGHSMDLSIDDTHSYSSLQIKLENGIDLMNLDLN